MENIYLTAGIILATLLFIAIWRIPFILLMLYVLGGVAGVVMINTFPLIAGGVLLQPSTSWIWFIVFFTFTFVVTLEQSYTTSNANEMPLCISLLKRREDESGRTIHIKLESGFQLKLPWWRLQGLPIDTVKPRPILIKKLKVSTQDDEEALVDTVGITRIDRSLIDAFAALGRNEEERMQMLQEKFAQSFKRATGDTLAKYSNRQILGVITLDKDGDPDPSKPPKGQEVLSQEITSLYKYTDRVTGRDIQTAEEKDFGIIVESIGIENFDPSKEMGDVYKTKAMMETHKRNAEELVKSSEKQVQDRNGLPLFRGADGKPTTTDTGIRITVPTINFEDALVHVLTVAKVVKPVIYKGLDGVSDKKIILPGGGQSS